MELRYLNGGRLVRKRGDYGMGEAKRLSSAQGRKLLGRTTVVVGVVLRCKHTSTMMKVSGT